MQNGNRFEIAYLFKSLHKKVKKCCYPEYAVLFFVINYCGDLFLYNTYTLFEDWYLAKISAFFGFCTIVLYNDIFDVKLL